MNDKQSTAVDRKQTRQVAEILARAEAEAVKSRAILLGLYGAAIKDLRLKPPDTIIAVQRLREVLRITE